MIRVYWRHEILRVAMAKKKTSTKSEHIPSAREKCQKVDMAISAISKGTNYVRNIAEKHNQLAYKLLSTDDAKVENMLDVMDWVLTFLHDIKDADPVKCFVGKKALRCYEKGFKDIFLFPYKIWSEDYQTDVYLKFGIRKQITNDGSETEEFIYCHLDCHEDEKYKAT